MDRSTVGRHAKRLVVWIVVALLVVVALAVIYAGTPYHGTPESIAAAEDDPRVSVDRSSGGYVLQPADRQPEAAVVFYPGGRVHPDAYVGSLAPLAREANVTVVIPRMPLNLAVVDYGLAEAGVADHAADRAMADRPEISEWYVGGHSLGGAMACRYVATGAEVEGVLLYASYCDIDLSDRDIAAVSVTGDADGVLDREADDRNRGNLPPSTRVAELAGVNHTQFGTYRGHDEPSGTSYETAHSRLNGVVVPWLRSQTALHPT
ncbi:alpha/beta hydrolase [Halohasta salina]|uniref:alpha/beta hydrolase n=1 Tax=Halohasta salina TaxID=2961621 RepID=UPI0020A3B17A|nr:alpha/beta hydrolase [Halohasta salina]